MLKGDVAPKRVAELVRASKVDFELTAEVEKDLRDAGADEGLVAAIREVVLQNPAVASLEIKVTPGNVEVYLDDERVGKTNAEGMLNIPNIAPGRHRVRLSLQGYSDREKELDLVGGSPGRTPRVSIPSARPSRTKW